MAIQIPIITSLEDSGIKAARAAFNNFKSAVNDAEGGMNKFKAGGKAALDAVKANAATFAIAAGASIATFATKAVKDFYNLSIEAGKFADSTGLGVEQASRMIEVAGDMGIEAGTIETALGRMNRALGTSPDKFKELGVEIGYTTGGAIDANETFLNVIDRLNSISDPAERARVASELLGKGWQSMGELIAGGSDKLRKSLEEVSDAKVVNEQELENSRRLREQMDELGDKFSDIASQIGTDLIPALIGLADAFLWTYEKAKQFFDFMELGTDITKTATFEAMVAAEDMTTAWEEGYRAMIDAEDATRYMIPAFEDTSEAVYDLNIQWKRMLDTITETEQINNVRDALDDVKEAAAEAFADPTKAREYQEAVNELIQKIAELATTVKMTNEDQNTLKVLVDTGQLERAVELMAIIKTGRGRVSLPEAVQAMTENDLFLGTLGIPGRAMGGPVGAGGTYLVGEQGPELLTLGSQSGYVTPNHAIGGNITVNVTSADPNEVVRILQQYARQYGPVPVNTRRF